MEKFDLIVSGGGPAGSSLATFVAKQGHRVLLLEKERFPRYQIGESLLPSTAQGICSLLGIWEEVENAGFQRKTGGNWRWGKTPEPWSFVFRISPTFGEERSYAWQVERSRFDNILLKNAKKCGVDVREQHAVSEVIEEAGRVTGVRYVDAAGVERTAHARYFADATGHQCRNFKLLGERVYDEHFRHVALFCYFEGGLRSPPPHSGSILCVAFKSGWFWYIPLSDSLTSVGAVVDLSAVKRLNDGHEAAMNSFIEEAPLIKRYLASAKRVTEGDYGQFRVRKDYSYANTRFWKPGMFLLGDAACFIDPVFSSGVHLATLGGLLAARSVNTCLRGELDEEACFTEFERRYRREYDTFREFLIQFYNTYKTEEEYFRDAERILGSEDKGKDAFVRLIGGVSTASGDLFPEGQHPSQAIFNARYKSKEGAFAQTDAIEQQALLKDARPLERPMFEGGLVASADGFHWRRDGAQPRGTGEESVVAK